MKDKQERGITLIALVVTIVVLVILATISIIFIEKGIINKAETSRKISEVAEIKEALKIQTMLLLFIINSATNVNLTQSWFYLIPNLAFSIASNCSSE